MTENEKRGEEREQIKKKRKEVTSANSKRIGIGRGIKESE